MSGTTTPLVDIQQVLGDDILGDEATAQADAVLADIVDALDVDASAADDAADAVAGAVDEAGDAADDAAGDVAALIGDQTAFAWATPANNSGAQALARLSLDGSSLRVDIEGSGFTPGEAHALTLSGFADGAISLPPSIEQDADGNGRLDAAEVAAATGPVLAALGEAVADADGNISFSSTVTPDADALAALQTRLDGRFLGIDGLDAAGPETAFDAAAPAAGGRLLDLPGGLGTLIEALTAISPGFAADAFRTLLDAQAPYTLAPDGSGAVAAEDPGAAGTEATRFVSLIQPANNSGVLGAAFVTFDETAGTVAVDVELGGLVPDAEHPMHIHGLTSDAPSLIPNLQLDADADGFLEGNEAMSVVGPVLLGFSTDGTVSDATLVGNFPVADAEGRVSLSQSYAFDLADAGQAQLFEELQDRVAGRQIEVHGLTTTALQGAGTEGEVEGEAGYQPGLSVASGTLLPVQGAAGAIAAGVAYIIQAELLDEAPSLEGFLQAVVPSIGDGGLIG